MKRLLEICIAISIISLTGCNSYQLKYEVPKYISCRLLKKTIFCINQNTNEEFEIPISDGLGFLLISPEDEDKLGNFVNDLMLDNIKMSKCRNRKCIRDIIKNRIGRE